MDTYNKFFVGKYKDQTVIQAFNKTLTQDDALNLAAWLVALNDKEKFDKIYEKVINI